MTTLLLLPARLRGAWCRAKWQQNAPYVLLGSIPTGSAQRKQLHYLPSVHIPICGHERASAAAGEKQCTREEDSFARGGGGIRKPDTASDAPS